VAGLSLSGSMGDLGMPKVIANDACPGKPGGADPAMILA
jgi:hypothetical protein